MLAVGTVGFGLSTSPSLLGDQEMLTVGTVSFPVPLPCRGDRLPPFGPQKAALGDPSACVWRAVQRALNIGGGGAPRATVAGVEGLKPAKFNAKTISEREA